MVGSGTWGTWDWWVFLGEAWGFFRNEWNEWNETLIHEMIRHGTWITFQVVSCDLKWVSISQKVYGYSWEHPEVFTTFRTLGNMRFMMWNDAGISCLFKKHICSGHIWTWIVTIDDLERVVSLQFRWVHPGGGWWTDPIRDLFVWAWPGHSLCCKLGIDPARYFACHQSSTCFMEARSCLSHTERLLPSGFPDFKYSEVYFSFLSWIEVGQDYVAVGRAQWFGSCGFGYPWCLGHIRATPLRLGFHERRLACSKHAGRTFNVSLDAHSMAAAAEGFP